MGEAAWDGETDQEVDLVSRLGHAYVAKTQNYTLTMD